MLKVYENNTNLFFTSMSVQTDIMSVVTDRELGHMKLNLNTRQTVTQQRFKVGIQCC